MGGWLFLGDIITARQASGMGLAVVGMVAYGVATSQCVPDVAPAVCHAVARRPSPHVSIPPVHPPTMQGVVCIHLD